MDTLMITMAKQQILVDLGKLRDDGDLTVSDLDKAIKEHADLLSEEEVFAERRKILDKHRLKEISNSTICRWLKFLGFRHKNFEKTFNCDGHEAEDTVKERIEFIVKYLDIEQRTHSWVLVKGSDLDALIQEAKVEECI